MEEMHLKEIPEAEFIDLGVDNDYGGWAWVCGGKETEVTLKLRELRVERKEIRMWEGEIVWDRRSCTFVQAMLILQCVAPPNGDALNWGYRIEINQSADWDWADMQIFCNWSGGSRLSRERACTRETESMRKKMLESPQQITPKEWGKGLQYSRALCKNLGWRMGSLGFKYSSIAY